MKILNDKKGFTLLEVLIVVFVIGIFAGIALPGYRRVMIKSRLSQIDNMMDAAKKNVQAYVDMNGSPSKNINVLFGSNAPFPVSCSKTEGDYCVGSEIKVSAQCGSSNCSIEWKTIDEGSLKANATYNMDYSGEGHWTLNTAVVPSDGGAKKVYCDWFKERGFSPNQCK